MKKMNEFEKYEFGDYYQKNGKIYRKKDDRVIAQMSIKEMELTYDKLELFPTLFDLEFYHGYLKDVKTKKGLSKQQLLEYLADTELFINDTDIEKVINNYKFYGSQEGIVKIKEEIFKKGFFFLDGKIVENTDIKDLKYTKEDVAHALELLNEVLNHRGNGASNDGFVYRFSLHAPFHFCIKKLSYANNNTVGMMLYGYPQTAKTTSALIGRWFYSSPCDYNPTAETLSALGKMLQEETLPTILDDSYELLNNHKVSGALKKSMFSEYFRTVSDTSDLSKNMEYIALSTPLFTFNESYELKDGMQRRFIPVYYDKTMVIDNEADKSFIKEYKPKSYNSPLSDLRYIGRVFADSIIPYFEREDEELIDIDKLTIKILQEISEEVDVELNPNLLSPIKRDDSLDESIEDKLINGLHLTLNKHTGSKSFRDSYTVEDFIQCANFGKFNWLHYQKKNCMFVINKSQYVKHCRNLTKNSISFEDINEILDLGLMQDAKSFTVNGKTIRGYQVDEDEIGKFFAVEVDE